MAAAFGLEQEILEAAVLEANGIIEEGLARLLSDSASSSQLSSPSQSQRYPSLDSPMSSSFGQSSSLYTSQVKILGLSNPTLPPLLLWHADPVILP